MPDKLREKRNKFTEKFLRLPRMKAAFEDAWYLHGRMFGPIMEPAFVGEIAARFRLVSALNLISRGEVFTGMRRLDRQRISCLDLRHRLAQRRHLLPGKQDRKSVV